MIVESLPLKALGSPQQLVYLKTLELHTIVFLLEISQIQRSNLATPKTIEILDMSHNQITMNSCFVIHFD